MDERVNRDKPLTLRRAEVSKRTLYFLFLTFCLQIKVFMYLVRLTIKKSTQRKIEGNKKRKRIEKEKVIEGEMLNMIEKEPI